MLLEALNDPSIKALYASTGEEPERAIIIAPVAMARATAKIGMMNKRKLLIREQIIH